jgi:hypothetical protein
MKPFSFYHQPDAMDCGSIRQQSDRLCLRMVAKQYGKLFNRKLKGEKFF